MCNFFSALGMRDGSLRWHPMLDSHHDLLTYFEMDDSQDYQSRFVKLELKPGEDWLNPETWEFVIDEPTAPVWCDDAVRAEFRKAMESVVRGMIIPEGMTKKIADGCLILSPKSGIHHLAGGRIMYASRANLSGAYLHGADLSGAHLTRAHLTYANLSGAYLHGADLSGANLHGADLSGANLHGADLSGANLARANLADSNLARANLTDAKLAGANLARANLTDAKLAGAKGQPITGMPTGWVLGENGIWEKAK